MPPLIPASFPVHCLTHVAPVFIHSHQCHPCHELEATEPPPSTPLWIPWPPLCPRGSCAHVSLHPDCHVGHIVHVSHLHYYSTYQIHAITCPPLLIPLWMLPCILAFFHLPYLHPSTSWLPLSRLQFPHHAPWPHLSMPHAVSTSDITSIPASLSPSYCFPPHIVLCLIQHSSQASPCPGCALPGPSHIMPVPGMTGEEWWG